jgi:hypothetical protein
MLLLTGAQMLQVRVQYEDHHLIRPRMLVDGKQAVSERVLTDPMHASCLPVLSQGEIASSFAAFHNLGDGEFIRLDGKSLIVLADDKPWTAQPTATGHRFELRPGESQRAEFVSRFDTFGTGDEVWQSLTFEINIRDGFEAVLPPPSWGIIAQFHSIDTAQTGGRSPVLYYDLGDNEFRIVTRSDTDGPNVEKVRYSAAVPAGQVNIVTRFVLGASGQLQVWRDGVEIVNISCPIGYYNYVGDLCYLQWGNYHQAGAPISAVTTSNMRWGLTDLSGKILNPDPI